jgi:hypothetical protein
MKKALLWSNGKAYSLRSLKVSKKLENFEKKRACKCFYRNFRKKPVFVRYCLAIRVFVF